MHSEEVPSCQDLFYVRNQAANESSQVSTHAQDESPNEPTLESIAIRLDASVNKLKNDISMIVDKKVVAYGVWDVDLMLVKIDDAKTLKQYPPHFINNCAYLSPFEALFMLECRSLVITCENIPFSIEDGYNILLSDKRNYKLYRVFSTLSKNGYYVRKSAESNTINANIIRSNEKSPNENLKHSIIENEQNENRKRLKQEITNNKKEGNINYKAVTSIRPFDLGHLRKLSRIDKKLQACCDVDKPSKSILYCLRDSAVPVAMNKHLSPLWGDEELKPLVGLSAIHNTQQLFELMQRAGPKCHSTQINEQVSNIEVRIDFEVFRSKAESSTTSAPLFCVIVVDQNDSLPSASTTKRLQSNCSSPLFFALCSDSLELNFYGLENITVEKEYPTLWEKYYA